MAAVSWAFAALWLALLVLFNELMLRDGAPDETDPNLMCSVLCLFWLGGIGLASYAATRAVFSASVDPDLVTFTWRYPQKRHCETLAQRDVRPPRLVEGRGSDTEQYFHVLLDLPFGTFTCAEGHDRAACQTARERFMDALTDGGARPLP